MTTILRLETYPNGCYKQRVTEPDLWNSTRFYQTEQLICPPGVNASSMAMLTQQLQKNVSVIQPGYFTPAYNNPMAVFPPPAVPPPVGGYTNPAVSAGVMPPPAAIPSDQRPVLQHPYSPAVIPPNATSHVALLSQNTGFYNHEKKKSSANSLCKLNGFLVFVVVTIFLNLNQILLRQ